MDVLDDILHTLELRGALYFRTDFSPPWAIAVPEFGQAARFHLVVKGVCHVRTGAGTWARLGPGDLIMIPKGRAHVIADETGRQALALDAVLEEAGYDGEGVLSLGDGRPEAATQMICGHFSFRDNADHPLLAALPESLLLTNADRLEKPWADDVIRLFSRRAFSEQTGSQAAAMRLSEALFIELLRAGMERSASLKSVLGALRDRHVGEALRLIHTRPGEPWTVERLAHEVGMSRSRFAARFSALLGVGPMAYLSDWRLQKALSLLERSRTSIQQIAGETGYRSPAAFSRAFAGRFGVAPRDYRRITS